MFHAPRAAPDALAFMGFGAQEARCFTTGAKLTAPERKTREISTIYATTIATPATTAAISAKIADNLMVAEITKTSKKR